MSVVELASELSGGDFGDARLNRRAHVIAQALGQYPNVSIPAALKSRADIEGAYRFFNHDSVTPDRIFQPHIEATYRRMDTLDFALLVQDTTEIDLTRPQQQVKGAGPMDSESRRGAFFHPMVAFDAAGVPLGIVGQKTWTRVEISRATKTEKAEHRRKTPIENKESYRWIEGLRWAEKAATACSQTTIVCVGDSESDIYELFAAATASKQPNLHLLVRAGQNRNTTENQDWVEQVRSTAKIGDQTVNVRARIAKTGAPKSARSRSREARTAELEIRKATIELRRPLHGECPEMDCEVMFEPSEWKSVFSVLGKPIPRTGCPSLNEVVRAIARLGGFMNRPKDHPGTQTLWVGLQRSYDLSNAWNTFGPGAKNFSTD